MRRILSTVIFALVALGASASARRQAAYPAPVEHDFIVRNFTFRSGETLDIKMHYRTVGTLQTNARGHATNAVLVMHGTGGSGAPFFTTTTFASELFGPGQLLDGTKYFMVVPDSIGHGQSTKPSDGLHAKFPHYGYLDLVEAVYRLLTEGLGVTHARLVMGTSMGGMQTWLWGEEHPDFMDALMPLASVPAPISGRNRAWRRVVIDAIRSDPAWHDGDYTTQPPSLRTAGAMNFVMSSNPLRRQAEAPTLTKADTALDEYIARYVQTADANDVLYAFEASRDYDPSPKLEQIRAPLCAVNSADDLINPPELRILEREIRRVPHGKAVVVPMSDLTNGHQTHSIPPVWRKYLEQLLKRS